MRAHSPEEICTLFQDAMAEGDIDSVLSVYDRKAVFVNKSGEVTKGRRGLREALAPLAAMKARLDFTVKAVVEAGDIALMHTQWTVSSPQPMKVHAIEVARRQLELAHRRPLHNCQGDWLLIVCAFRISTMKPRITVITLGVDDLD